MEPYDCLVASLGWAASWRSSGCPSQCCSLACQGWRCSPAPGRLPCRVGRFRRHRCSSRAMRGSACRVSQDRRASRLAGALRRGRDREVARLAGREPGGYRRPRSRCPRWPHRLMHPLAESGARPRRRQAAEPICSPGLRPCRQPGYRCTPRTALNQRTVTRGEPTAVTCRPVSVCRPLRFIAGQVKSAVGRPMS
jgi:hypothetical protein